MTFWKKIFFNFKLKNIKILDELRKNFFYFKLKNVKILDELRKIFLF